MYKVQLVGSIKDICEGMETDADISDSIKELDALRLAFNPEWYAQTNTDSYVYINMYFKHETQAIAVIEILGTMSLFNATMEPSEFAKPEGETPWDKAPTELKNFIVDSMMNESKDDLVDMIVTGLSQMDIDEWKANWEEFNAMPTISDRV